MSSDDTTLTLTSLRNGLALDVQAAIGLVRAGSRTQRATGFAISYQTDTEGLSYPVIGMVDDARVQDPPAIEVDAAYLQPKGYDEVDLEIRFTDIPEGSEVAVESGLAALTLPRQAIKGSSFKGVQGYDLGPVDTGFALRLWVPDPEGLTADSALSMSISKIAPTKEGPVRKTLLQKITLDLGH